ncbi:MAG: hypothetical protein ACRCW9_03895 [Cetobacterium sp.]
MASSAIAVQSMLNTGTVVTTESANADGNYFNNDGHTYLQVTNGGGSSINVTIASPVNCSQGSTHPIVVAVGAGVTKYIGGFDKTRFNDPVTGRVNVTYSAVTTVTVAVVSVGV